MGTGYWHFELTITGDWFVERGEDHEEQMRLSTTAVATAIIYALVLVQPAVAGNGETCNLSTDLSEIIRKEYPSTRPLRLTDLEEDERAIFLKDHGNRCPGVATVNFYGDKKPTLALVLVPLQNSAKGPVKLVVASKSDESWNLKLLDTMKDSAPVVWGLGPGTYKDVYKKKTIRASNPVIVLWEYYSWATLYAWDGKEVSRIWIAD